MLIFGKLGHGDTKSLHRPRLIPSLQNINFIACGASISAAINAFGQLYLWGECNFGKIYDPYVLLPKSYDTKEPAKSISIGVAHLVMISDSENLYCFGKQTSGCLGNTEIESVKRKTPICFQYNS